MNETTWRYRSEDGLVSAGDPAVVATWDAIGRRMASDQRRASALLRERGVKMEHPDDGWIGNRGGAEYLNPAYPAFGSRLDIGDLLALGWPWHGYRIVRVTSVEHRMFGIVRYHYTDTGERVPSLRP